MFTSVLSVFGDVLAPRPNKRKEIWAFLRGGQYDKALISLREPNHGFVVTEKDSKSGLTALHYASAAGKLDLIIELLVQGADVNAIDEAGNSVLHFATQNNQRSAVEVLLRYGALPNITNNSGLYPVEMTTNSDVTELFQRDKHNIFSPVVTVRPTNNLRQLENDPELFSEKILGSDLLEDLNESLEKLQVGAHDPHQSEEYTIVGISSAKKPLRSNHHRGDLYPIADTSRDEYDSVHEQNDEQSSPVFPSHQLPPPPPLCTPPGKFKSSTLQHTNTLPTMSINHLHPSGLFSPDSFHHYYSSHYPNNEVRHTERTQHQQVPTRHSSLYDLSQARLIEAAQETAKVHQLTTEEFEARRMVIRYCQKFNEKGLTQYLQYDPTLPTARLAGLGGLAVDGQTPLHVAARFNNLEALKLFAKFGEKVSFWVIDLQGRTPLHIAAEFQHDQVCAYLKEQMKLEMAALLHGQQSSQEAHEPVGIYAPVDLGGNTPLGCAKLSAKGKPKKALEDILFERGDRSILPVTPHEYRTGKSPWKPMSAMSYHSAASTHYGSIANTPYLTNTPYHLPHIQSTPLLSSHYSGGESSSSPAVGPLSGFPSSVTSKDHNLIYAYSEAHGWTPTMEDRIVISCPIVSKFSWSLFIVFDGHGGSFASSFLAAQFPGIFMDVTIEMERKYGIVNNLNSGSSSERFDNRISGAGSGTTSPINVPLFNQNNVGANSNNTLDDLDTTPEFLQEILTKSCIVADDLLQQHPRMKVGKSSTGDISCKESSGSTAIIVLVTSFYIAVANVGDSRAVLAKRLPPNDSSKTPTKTSNPSTSAVGNSVKGNVLHDPFAVASGTQTALQAESALPVSESDNQTISNEKSKHEKRPSISKVTTGLQAVALSRDHKARIAEEKQRAIAAGAKVELVTGGEDESADNAIHEIYTDAFVGRLRMSRSFGDFYLKQNSNLPAEQQAVIAVPEVRIHPRQSSDAFVVLACDGIWDVMSNQQVVDFVGESLGYTVYGGPVGGITTSSLASVCDSLLAECLTRGSHDNMSVIIIVPNTPPHLHSSGSSDSNHNNTIPLLLPTTPASTTQMTEESSQKPATRRKSGRSSKEGTFLEGQLPPISSAASNSHKHDEIDVIHASVAPGNLNVASPNNANSLNGCATPESSLKPSRPLYDLMDNGLDLEDDVQSPLNTKVGSSQHVLTALNNNTHSVRKQLHFQ